MGFVYLGCSENELVNERQSLGEIGWIQKNKFEIPFEITDTTNLYDMQVAIRQTNTYSFYNLYFISEILSEAGTSLKKAEAEAAANAERTAAQAQVSAAVTSVTSTLASLALGKTADAGVVSQAVSEAMQNAGSRS